jgi:uronate dehydrogenase
MASPITRRCGENRHAEFLGWKPRHSSARWQAEILAAAPEDPADPATIYQGGAFVTAGHPED